ncbi:MAG: hypothetical protein ACLTWK_00605 [Eisenbergiella sp.]
MTKKTEYARLRSIFAKLDNELKKKNEEERKTYLKKYKSNNKDGE